MKASYTVTNTAEIEVTPNDPEDEALVYDVSDVTKINVTNFGNLGTIRVKTNSMGWDVLMSTDNGGRMKNSAAETGDWTFSTNIFGQNYDSVWVSTGGAEYLTYGTSATSTPTPGLIAGSTADTVLLRIAIGVAKSGKANGAGTDAQIYPMLDMSGAGEVVPPVVIDNDGILTTQKGLAGGVKLSFADSIGGHYSSSGTPPVGKFSTGIYGLTSGDVGWGDIQTKGFPAPKGNNEPMEEYFYVNVGIDPTLYRANGLGSNKEGTYEETFYFELVAKF